MDSGIWAIRGGMCGTGEGIRSLPPNSFPLHPIYELVHTLLITNRIIYSISYSTTLVVVVLRIDNNNTLEYLLKANVNLSNLRSYS